MNGANLNCPAWSPEHGLGNLVEIAQTCILQMNTGKGDLAGQEGG